MRIIGIRIVTDIGETEIQINLCVKPGNMVGISHLHYRIFCIFLLKAKWSLNIFQPGTFQIVYSHFQ